MRASNPSAAWFATLVFCCVAHNCQARYELVENFNDLVLGAISGQNEWSAGSGNLVEFDPADPANYVLAVTSQSTTVRKTLFVPNATTRMVFLRFRFATQLSGSFGLSHLNAPTEFSDFGPELNLTNTMPDLRIANGDTTGVYDSLVSLNTDEWYNMWLLVDNNSKTTEVWLKSPAGSAAATDKLANNSGDDVFGFRTATRNDLKNFFIKTGSGSSGEFGPLYIDDIYVESADGLNLSSPVPTLPGDYNLDGSVTGADFETWRQAFGTVGGSDADGNADGIVDAADYIVWRDNVTVVVTNSFQPMTIPEPTTSTLLVLASLVTLAKLRSGLSR